MKPTRQDFEFIKTKNLPNWAVNNGEWVVQHPKLIHRAVNSHGPSDLRDFHYVIHNTMNLLRNSKVLYDPSKLRSKLSELVESPGCLNGNIRQNSCRRWLKRLLKNDQKVKFTHSVKVTGNLYTSFYFKSEEEQDVWLGTELTRYRNKYGDISVEFHNLPGLVIGDKCHCAGEGDAIFKITGIIDHGDHRYSFSFDKCLPEEIRKCRPVVLRES